MSNYHVFPDSEISLAVYRRADYVSPESAQEDGALYVVPSTLSYGDSVGLADAVELAETIGMCSQNDPQAFAVVAKNIQGVWVELTPEVLFHV